MNVLEAPANIGKLSEKNHWEAGFRRVSLPRTIRTTDYNYFRFDKFFRAVAPRGQKRFLEIGCGASAWLVYFAKTLGYSVEGVDYSDAGCELARENLRLNHVEGSIQCRDLFSLDRAAMGAFDVIFSYGVVEHFEEPSEVLSILSGLLAPGGWMVVIVPNLLGIYGPLQRWWNESIYRIHKILTPEDLARQLVDSGLTKVQGEYFGTFFLSVLNLTRPDPCGAFQKIIPRFVHRLDRYVTATLRQLSIETESKLFSPYVIATATKPVDAA